VISQQALRDVRPLVEIDDQALSSAFLADRCEEPAGVCLTSNARRNNLPAAWTDGWVSDFAGWVDWGVQDGDGQSPGSPSETISPNDGHKTAKDAPAGAHSKHNTPWVTREASCKPGSYQASS
jgi:hypothetical protein